MNRVLNLKFLRLFFFLAICLVSAHATFATTVVMPTDTSMVIGSRAIIGGRVLNIETALDTQTNRIYTYVTIRVQEVFKGDIRERKIVLKEEGGQVAGRGSLIFGTPEFTLDEQVILYLDTWADGAFRVHQMFLGKFNIINDPNSGHQFAVRSEMGDRVLVMPNPQQSEANNEITNRLELSAYKEMVRSNILANVERSFAFEQKYYSNTPKLAKPAEYQELVGKGKIQPQWTYIHSSHPRWFEPDSGQPVVFRINPAGAPSSQTINDIATSLNTWSTVPGCALRATIGANTDACGPDQGLNTIIFNNCDGRWSASGGSCQGVLALGGLSWLPGSTRVINGVSFVQGTAGFISFNPFAACAFSNSCNVQEITTHELGHAFGLGHSADGSATMAAFAHFDGRCASLRADDIAGIVSIYPGIGGGGGPLSITTTSPLTNASIGIPYSQAIIATGGTLPYTWSVSAGTLPAGITLNAQTGLLVGTPTTAGTANFTLQVRDAVQATVQKAFTITVASAASQYNAQFVSQTVPTTLQPGQTFQINMKYINTGTLPWIDGLTTNFYLVSQNPALNQTWGGNGVSLSNYPTQPGAQLDLNFSAIAPLAPGTYNFQWQMYQNGGINFFGDLTPNVVIQVGSGGPAPTNDAAFVSQTVPTTMTAGQTYNISVVMRNSGTTTWSTGTYKLGSQNPQDNTTWGFNRVNLPAAVAPGGQATFNFAVIAPSTPGTYNCQWKMLQDSASYFGTASTNVAVSVTAGTPTPTNDAVFVSQTAPTTMTAGQTYTVSVVMRNSGTTTWSTTAYKLGSQNPQDNTTWGMNRVSLPSTVAPGGQATFTFTVTAPSTPGTYNCQWKMLQESAGYFGTASTNATIPVASPAGTTPQYIGWLDAASCTVIRGWAADRNRLNTSITVSLYDGATLLASGIQANQFSAGVGAFLGDNGNHSFVYNVPSDSPLKAGSSAHNVRVVYETSTTELNDSPKNVGPCAVGAPQYIGWLDAASCTVIRGWAADRNRLNTSITVSLYDGATLLASGIQANQFSAGVGAFLGDNGNHSFVYNVPSDSPLKTGNTHNVRVVFETSSTELNDSPKTIGPCSAGAPQYIGWVDAASCTVIRGWAADRNRLNTSITVSLYDGATLIASGIQANQFSAGVGAFLGDNGNHSFVYNVPSDSPLKSGSSAHTVRVVYETSTTELNDSPKSIGPCAAGSPQYIGWVDAASCTVIRGWAADRNRLNTSITVSIYDGANLLVSGLPANIFYAGVGAYLGDNGNHGFVYNVPSDSPLKSGGAHNVRIVYETGTTELNDSPTLVGPCSASASLWVPSESGLTPFYKLFGDTLLSSLFQKAIVEPLTTGVSADRYIENRYDNDRQYFLNSIPSVKSRSSYFANRTT